MLRLGLIQRMKQDFGARELLPHDRMIGEVVEVAVRQPQAGQLPAARGDLLEQRRGRVVRRIKKHRLPGGLIRDQEAIRHGDPAGSSQYDHTGSVTVRFIHGQHGFAARRV